MARFAFPLVCSAAALSAALLLSGCAHAPLPPEPPLPLLHDELFGTSLEVTTVAAAPGEDVFAMSEAMRSFMTRELSGGAVRRDPRQALLDALYGHNGRLRLSYDAVRTRTAAQAFDARSGNCLSLVIMTAAFAKQMGLPVSFRAAVTEDLYSRSNGLVLANSHVYLVLEQLPVRGERIGPVDDSWTVDFLPPSERGALRSVALPERTVVAMFLNNRAAESLAEGRVEEGYRWARAAVLQDPAFAPAANTLAVVYMRRNQWSAAEAALRFALRREADSTAALSNLQAVLRTQGRTAEADAVQRQLVALQPVAPFHEYELGRAAMDAGRFSEASDLFKRELRRQPYQPEVHFWAAQARWRLGDVKGAAEHMQRASETSLTNESRAHYSAKLEYLKAQRVQ